MVTAQKGTAKHSNGRLLFETGNGNGIHVRPGRECKYEAISSVWERSDGELLEAMLSFYPSVNPEPILDATYNAGRFWKGSSRDVWSMDIDPKYKPMIVGDNRKMKDNNREN